jgi:hypothetical protein
MLRFMIATILLALPLAGQAGDLVLNDLKAQNGIQLSADELHQLIPNAKVVSYLDGSTRNWTNGSDGKLVAYGDARGSLKRLQASATAHGTWHIGKNGAYCVSLEWPKRSEKWCKYIFKVGGKYYGVKSVTDGTATAHEFEFSK